ncbi:membrane-associated guanylate kinase [Huso huso]|uniref:Membrane-associated guanylate kinase n=2 Tax=Acipenseridae TaxID=7900 RepID=A0ABR0Z781_HUSHU
MRTIPSDSRLHPLSESNYPPELHKSLQHGDKGTRESRGNREHSRLPNEHHTWNGHGNYSSLSNRRHRSPERRRTQEPEKKVTENPVLKLGQQLLKKMDLQSSKKVDHQPRMRTENGLHHSNHRSPEKRHSGAENADSTWDKRQGRRRERSPERRREESSPPRRRRSLDRHEDTRRSPERKRNYSPERTRAKSTDRRRERSPERRRDRSPNRRYTDDKFWQQIKEGNTIQSSSSRGSRQPPEPKRRPYKENHKDLSI